MRITAFGPAILGVVAALGLAACGEAFKPKTPEHIALVKYCESDGGKQKDCECATDKTDKLVESGAISHEMYNALVLEAQGKPEESQAIIDKMDVHQQFGEITAVSDAKMACAGKPS